MEGNSPKKRPGLSKKSSFSFRFSRSSSPTTPTKDENNNSSTGLSIERLKSTITLLECVLKERSKQIEIQAKESTFLRSELRRKDLIINQYDDMVKQYKLKEHQELGKLRREVKKLRHTITDNYMQMREHENVINQLQNKNEKLMSVMKPRDSLLPRGRAQGVSASPLAYSVGALKLWPKNTRWVDKLADIVS